MAGVTATVAEALLVAVALGAAIGVVVAVGLGMVEVAVAWVGARGAVSVGHQARAAATASRVAATGRWQVAQA